MPLALLSLVAAATLAQAPAAARPVSMAFPEFRLLEVSPQLGGFAAEHLATELEKQGLEVVTAKELSTLLGNERQKQMLGCSEDSSSCMAELANAVGAQSILQGDLASLGAGFQLTVKVLDSKNGATLIAYTGRVEGGTEELLEEFTLAAPKIAAGVRAGLSRKERGPPMLIAAGERPAPTLRSKAWIPAAAGAVLLGLGTASYLSAGSKYDALTARGGTPLLDSEATALRDEGKSAQTLGVAGIALGVAGLATAATFYALGGESAPAPTVAVTPNGVYAGFVGVLP